MHPTTKQLVIFQKHFNPKRRHSTIAFADWNVTGSGPHVRYDKYSAICENSEEALKKLNYLTLMKY